LNKTTLEEPDNNHKPCIAVVPREPTKAMLDAVLDWSCKKYGKLIGHEAALECWKVMLEVGESTNWKTTFDYPERYAGFEELVRQTQTLISYD